MTKGYDQRAMVKGRALCKATDGERVTKNKEQALCLPLWTLPMLHDPRHWRQCARSSMASGRLVSFFVWPDQRQQRRDQRGPLSPGHRTQTTRLAGAPRRAGRTAAAALSGSGCWSGSPGRPRWLADAGGSESTVRPTWGGGGAKAGRQTRRDASPPPPCRGRGKGQVRLQDPLWVWSAQRTLLPSC